MTKLIESIVLGRSRASDLESVRKLNCWGSDLVDVSILRKMPNVEVVSLSVNRIDTLEDFSFCKNLQELYIRKNNITRLSEICHLRHLSKLRCLWLADNPCAVGDMYRMTVLKTLPNLQKLDNLPVQEDELNDAIEQGKDLTLPSRSSSKSLARDFREEKYDDTENANRSKSSDSELAETNKIREQLGLKAVSAEKVSPVKPHRGNKARNTNILQAVLTLVKELDADSLEIVGNAVKNRLEAM